MKKNDLIDTCVNIDRLAKITKNYTGAEIEAVCSSAASFAFFKDADLNNMPKVNMYHFELALNEIKPSFGVNEKD